MRKPQRWPEVATLSNDTCCASTVSSQVQWSPDGNYLYTGGRKDAAILCWDVRYTQSTVYAIQREAGHTNQKLSFDIEPCGRHLLSGGQVRFPGDA